MAVGRWQLGDGSWEMAVGRWQLGDGSWEMADGRWEGERSKAESGNEASGQWAEKGPRTTDY